MLNKFLEAITGHDDLERVALKEDARLLTDYLKKRRVFVPKKPRKFLDAANFSQEQLIELFEFESKELDGASIELWILEVDGKKRLPAFSNQKRMEAFSAKMSKELDKVFGLGCIDVLVFDLAKQVEADFLDLNLFSPKSWELDIGTLRQQLRREAS